MKINFPQIGRGVKLMGIYRIDFDDTYFYIGSSKNLKRRFVSWKTMLNFDKYLKNVNIRNILPEVKNVTFPIIELHSCAETLIQRETVMISDNWSNTGLLNRCPDADYRKGPKGVRHYIGYVKKKPVYKPTFGVGSLPKPVAMFDMDGNKVKVYKSKTSAAKDLNVNKSTITDVLNGKVKHIKRHTFKMINGGGSFEEPIPFVPKVRTIKDTMPKFYQVEVNTNVIVSEFFNCSDAAEALGLKRKRGVHVADVIRGRAKSMYGFTFIYATDYHEKYG